MVEELTDISVKLENHEVRIDNLEKTADSLQKVTNTIYDLASSVDKLAINMENMLAEQRHQGERIKALESEPTNQWNTIKQTTITSIISVIAGALAVGLVYAMYNGI
jgi:hypothetical protein